MVERTFADASGAVVTDHRSLGARGDTSSRMQHLSRPFGHRQVVRWRTFHPGHQVGHRTQLVILGPNPRSHPQSQPHQAHRPTDTARYAYQ